MTTWNRGTLREWVQLNLGHPDGLDAAVVDAAINTAHQEWAERTRFVRARLYQTVAADTRSVDFNEGKILSVFQDSVTFDEEPLAPLPAEMLYVLADQTYDSSDPVYYAVINHTFYLYPSPSASGLLALYAVIAPTEKTADGDVYPYPVADIFAIGNRATAVLGRQLFMRTGNEHYRVIWADAQREYEAQVERTAHNVWRTRPRPAGNSIPVTGYER